MKGKEFYFPRNVKKEYNFFKEWTLKDIITKFLPALLIGLIICVLPPYNLIFKIIEIMLILIVITVRMTLLVVTPIKERPNIKFDDIKKVKKQYKYMQKLYFLEPRAARRYIDE